MPFALYGGDKRIGAVMRKRAALWCIVVLLIATVNDARAAKIRSDPALWAALSADPELRACACIRKAVWLDESYLRITVDDVRWKSLRRAARIRFGKRALNVTKAVYLQEWQTTDFYEEVFVVDRRGRLLLRYQP